MHILLTRPLENSHDLILRFKSLGHKVSHVPLISIEKVNYEKLDFSFFKGIIFTSANAIKNLDFWLREVFTTIDALAFTKK